jgi:hypothetical protein
MPRLTAIRFIAFAVTFSLLLTACRGGGAASPTVDLQAQIDATMQAVATQAQATLQAAIPTAAPATDTPSPSDTPAPTQTPPPTPTETLAADAVATSTPTPSVSGTMARITTNTNCRTGPSTSFPIVFTATKDSTVKVIFNSTSSEYVVVENPTNPGQTCWLWTKYVEFSGNLAGLPVATMPVLPTPSMSFSLTYIQVVQCTNWSLDFKIVNTGGATVQSYKIIAQDLDEHTQQTTTGNEFNERKSCVDTDKIPLLEKNDTGFLHANDFTFDPTGHNMKATVTVCTKDDLGGDCITQSISFTAK